MTDNAQDQRRPPAMLWIVFFLSGFAGLVYEVLWLRQLGSVFGVAAHAAATTLAVFFLGLAVGGYVWGKRVHNLRSPLRTYALLEVGIAVSALLFFGLHFLFREIYPALFALAAGRHTVLLLGKFLLAVVILFPPAFFMGGTLPVMGQHMVRHSSQLGTRASLLYLVNTAGAAMGAFAAGFLLPPWLGFRLSYGLAIGLNLVVALVAWRWDQSPAEQPKLAATPVGPDQRSNRRALPVSTTWVLILAGFSGALTLGLEVLWTRMFTQVLQNSVYTYSLILTLFLVALAGGSGLARYLCSRPWPQITILSGLLLLSGLICGVIPWCFRLLTDDMSLLAVDKGWAEYMLRLWGLGAVVIIPAGVVLGAIFPYLMRVSENNMRSAGWTIGRLAAVNTGGGIVGSLLAGFWLLGWIGLWRSLWLIAVLYLIAGVGIGVGRGRHRMRLMLAFVSLVLVTWVAGTGDRNLVKVDSPSDRIVQVKEGVHGTVAVIDRAGDLRLKVNNSYLLGTTASAVNLRFMSWIPLCLHPAAESVFFLGLGTGITASGAVDWPVSRITVAELNPDVIAADRTFFAPWLQGLFEDPRVEVVAADGRNHLFGSRSSYDVIISDMFLTHRPGVGNLYSVEHFRTVYERLNPDGVFAQWLPVFELSEGEFEVIAATMREVFGEVQIWRRGFSPKYPVMMLLGRKSTIPLDPDLFERNVAQLQKATGLSSELWFFNLPFAAYAGNVTGIAARLAAAPLNRDNRPVIEYMAPKIERERHSTGQIPTLSGVALGAYCQTILAGQTPDQDPYLQFLNGAQRKQVVAGLAYYRYAAAQRRGQTAEAARYLAEYNRALTAPEESPRQ